MRMAARREAPIMPSSSASPLASAAFTVSTAKPSELRHRLDAYWLGRRFGVAARVAHIVAGERQRIHAFGDLDLEHHLVLMAERHLGAGEIELPHPAEAFIIKRLDLAAVGLKPLLPFRERL